MANRPYLRARAAAWKGGVDLESDDLRIVLLKASHVSNTDVDGDEFLSEIDSEDVIGTSEILEGCAIVADDEREAFVFFANNATFLTAETGTPVAHFALFKDTGNPSTSQLIHEFDEGPGIGDFPGGGGMAILWPTAGVFPL